MRADIGDTEEGLAGGSSRKDLETMFQLIYLRFTAPWPDPVAFGVVQGTVEGRPCEPVRAPLDGVRGCPEWGDVSRTISASVWDQSRARRRDEPRQLTCVGQGPLCRRQRLYLLVFVGSFDRASMKRLVERYLAAFPHFVGTNLYGYWHATGDRRDRKQVRKGIEPKSQVSIVFTGAFENDEIHRLTLRAIAEMLSGNLNRTLREILGGTYGVSV